MATQVIMPQLGESVVEGTVGKWLKHEGEPVAEFEPLLEVETDKVDTEIPSPAGGVVLKILIPDGTTVKAGTVIGWIGQAGEAFESAAISDAPPAHNLVEEPAATSAPVTAVGRDQGLGFISPVVAKLAQEFQVDLSQVRGTGEGGRITKKDVLAFVEHKKKPQPAAWETPGEGDLFRPTELMFAAGVPAGIATPAPRSSVGAEAAAQPKTSAAAGGQLIPHTSLRRRIAEHMVFSKHTSPHVTTVMEADLQRITAHRAAQKAAMERDGVHLTFTAYFVAAAAAALKAFPLVNSSWTDEGVLLQASVNIGMATALGDEGLIVPVIKRADELSLTGVARAVNDLAGRARAHRLQPDEVHGGTFTITNHGTSGSLFATPIINQPQCAILGVGAIKKRPVVIQDAIAIRPMVYLSLTFDHRILDGSGADGFLADIVTRLENW